ncbi:uncharacterized protein FOMMEDRAFT_82995, partial [Fomitiporia mediterranea MF3/22]|uniref:uncharacterized protein n=1 Tax=Fomitiporia mediterranea (strain MF3/22) TaxID=694068 RepID=UPI0004408F0D
CPNGWEYSSSLTCCVPTAPDLPSCPARSSWDNTNYVCQPSSSAPMPSSIYGRKSRLSRRAEQSPLSPCPAGLQKCPISRISSSTDDEYECVETTADLLNCGGCAVTGEGRDCTAISRAVNVGCHYGTCIVDSCMKGYVPAEDGGSCVRASNRRIVRETS